MTHCRCIHTHNEQNVQNRLKHAGAACGLGVDVKLLDSETASILDGYDGCILF